MSRMGDGTNYVQSIRKTSWNVDRMILFRVPGSGNSKLGKFLLKLRAHHSGKFAPQEINPLYSISIANVKLKSSRTYLIGYSGFISRE